MADIVSPLPNQQSASSATHSPLPYPLGTMPAESTPTGSTQAAAAPAGGNNTAGAGATGAAGTPAAESNASAGATTPLVSGGRPGGAPARVYMNEKIVPYLLEGMKSITKEQPANPLRVLGEFLIQKSIEIEQQQQQQQPQAGKSPE